MIGQTRKQSLAEAAVNVLLGYGIAIAAQRAIFPLFGIRISLTQDLAIGLCFTVVSLVRSYLLRRLFNLWQIRSGT
ncbi:MAG: hypothetical protein QJR07_10470 [Acetobacteraceae bacterium]|nr:hypothetical protein [Acetobacteraceae bacterium]